MQENVNHQDMDKTVLPSPKQFRANFKEIFDSETTFGSAKAARMELLETVQDIIQEYITKDCKIVYIHGRLKEAGYTGSRKELSEWLVEKGLWTKREVEEKSSEAEPNLDENRGAKIADSVIPAVPTSTGPDAVSKKSVPALFTPDGKKVISVQSANSRKDV